MYHSFLCIFKNSGFPDCRRLPAVSCKTHHARWAADAKRVPFLLAEAKIPGGRTGSKQAPESLQQGLQSFAPHAFAWFARQIEYLRQPDEPGLRAFRISGLRIGFSLQSFVRAGFPLLYSPCRKGRWAINISGNWLPCALRRLDPIVLRATVSRGVRFQTFPFLSRARTAALRQPAQTLMRLPAHYRCNPSQTCVIFCDGACAPLYCHAFALLSLPFLFYSMHSTRLPPVRS